MKFLCLICAETVMEHMPPDVAAQHYREYAVFTEEVKHSGQFVSANRLLPKDTARTLRVRDGKIHVVDGPFAETREQLGGYYVIEARDMDDALAAAAKIPGAAIGCVEVRPIAADEPTLALGFDDRRPTR